MLCCACSLTTFLWGCPLPLCDDKGVGGIVTVGGFSQTHHEHRANQSGLFHSSGQTCPCSCTSSAHATVKFTLSSGRAGNGPHVLVPRFEQLGLNEATCKTGGKILGLYVPGVQHCCANTTVGLAIHLFLLLLGRPLFSMSTCGFHWPPQGFWAVFCFIVLIIRFCLQLHFNSLLRAASFLGKAPSIVLPRHP